jgi:hypothetical protein
MRADIERKSAGAFNGLTLVGEFPEYDPPGMIIILR